MAAKNYHTHTFRCRHATGDIIDYARLAYEQGADVLGISDHVALPDNRWLDVRMSYNQLDDYERAFETTRRLLPQIKIIKGMECEYAPEYHTYLEDELLGERHYDYLVGGAHYTPINGEWYSSFEYLDTPKSLKCYSNYVVRMMETKLFTFIAHPDVFGGCNEKWSKDLEVCSRDILQAAQDTKTPLEINGNGFRRRPRMMTSNGSRPPYPWKPFWELATEYQITVLCNSDAHHPKHVLANIDDAYFLAEDLNLKFADLSYLENKHRHNLYIN